MQSTLKNSRRVVRWLCWSLAVSGSLIAAYVLFAPLLIRRFGTSHPLVTGPFLRLCSYDRTHLLTKYCRLWGVSEPRMSERVAFQGVFDCGLLVDCELWPDVRRLKPTEAWVKGDSGTGGKAALHAAILSASQCPNQHAVVYLGPDDTGDTRSKQYECIETAFEILQTIGFERITFQVNRLGRRCDALEWRRGEDKLRVVGE